MNPYLQVALTVGGAALVQWTIVAFAAGRLNQRVDDQGREIKELRGVQGQHSGQLTNHERRISHIEGSKGIPLAEE